MKADIKSLAFFSVAIGCIFGNMVFHVKCPEDERLREMIESKENNEEVSVQCVQSLPGIEERCNE